MEFEKCHVWLPEGKRHWICPLSLIAKGSGNCSSKWPYEDSKHTCCSSFTIEGSGFHIFKILCIDHIWLVVWNMAFIFPFSWEFHHPNWRTPSFFRGVGSTTNQHPSYVCCLITMFHIGTGLNPFCCWWTLTFLSRVLVFVRAAPKIFQWHPFGPFVVLERGYQFLLVGSSTSSFSMGHLVLRHQFA